MVLVKLGYGKDVEEGGKIVKESFDRSLVLYRSNGALRCIEVPDTAYSTRDIDGLSTVPGAACHQIYEDNDGLLWVTLPDKHKPKVEKGGRPVGEGYGPAGTVPGAQPPPPLVPFAGCDRKAMPPSPAKPLSATSSPMPKPAGPSKPSPFKERVEAATEAVARRNWGERQSKMAEFFTTKVPPKAPAPPARPTNTLPSDMDF